MLHRNKQKKILLSGVSGMVLSTLMLIPAGAQSAPAQDDMETVVVTGIRASLQSAMEAKKDASKVVDAIDAEGIGKFPDKNLGEALQRVTGVQITRQYGEGNMVSIRGGDPNMTRVEMNGTGVLSLTVAGGDRAVDFRDLPVEFVSRLEVVKSPTADMSEGGLGGTVNVITRRPFDSKEPFLAGSVQGIYSNLAHSVDPKVALIGSRLFFHDTLGVLFSAQWSQQHLYDDTANTTGWLQQEAVAGTDGTPANAYGSDFDQDGTADWYPQIPRYIHNQRMVGRKALSLIIDYHPSETFKFYIDTNYAVAKENDNVMYLQLSANTGVFDYDETTVGDENTVSHLVLHSNGDEYVSSSTCATANDTAGCLPLSLTYRNVLGGMNRTQLTEGVGFSWDADPQLNVAGRFDYGHAKVANNVVTVTANAFGLDEAIVDYSGKYHAPNMQFPDFDTTSSDNIDSVTAQWSPEVDNSRETSEKIDLDYKPPWLVWLEVKAGYQRHEYRMQQTLSRKTIGLTCRGDTSSGYYIYYETSCSTIQGIVDDTATVNKVPFYSTGDLGFSDNIRYWNSLTMGTVKEIMSTAESLGSDYDPYDLTTSNPNSGYNNTWTVYLDNWVVSEATNAWYGEALFNFPDFYVPVSGNVGLRYVDTKTRSSGYTSVTTDDDVTYPTDSYSGGYHEFLPALNIKADIIPGSLIGRFAFSKVMSRPAPSNIAIKRSLDVVGYTGSEGNPNLKPFLSTDFDLGLEYYFGSVNYASVALFQKKITRFIESTSTDEDVDGVTYSITRPRNNSNPVTVNGIELGLQYAFDWMPWPMNNTGIMANATLQKDHGYDATSLIDGSNLPFQGLSRESYNISGYYEDSRISTRLSYNWRSHYLSAAYGRGNLPEFYKAYGQLDASISYTFMEGVSVFVEGTNLLDAQMIEYNTNWRPIQLETFGSKYYFGLRAKY